MCVISLTSSGTSERSAVDSDLMMPRMYMQLIVLIFFGDAVACFVPPLTARLSIATQRTQRSPCASSSLTMFPLDGHIDNAEDEQASDDPAVSAESKSYLSHMFQTRDEWTSFVSSLRSGQDSNSFVDPLWEMVKLEAKTALLTEPEAGPQLYQGILSQKSLLEAIIITIAHEIETELMPATSLKNLFLEMLTPEDEVSIHLDVMAVAMRSGGIGNSMSAILFQRGLHALVCYRVGHRLWLAERKGLAHYLQSTVSRIFSADIHPAAVIAGGIYMNCGGGIVIGETVVIGEDVSILQGVTLGGTGKEVGNRHPKVGSGVTIDNGAILLGNIKIGDGSIVNAKSIVTKPVPPLARMNGVPAKVTSYRKLTDEEGDNSDEWEKHLQFKYLNHWKQLANDNSSAN